MKKITCTLLIILLILFIISCVSREEKRITSTNTTGISYIKDNKTGLCFAKFESTTHGGWIITSISNVPCDKAGKLIK